MAAKKEEKDAKANGKCVCVWGGLSMLGCTTKAVAFQWYVACSIRVIAATTSTQEFP